jgi:methylenetetrahydrofolate dehydrogenase (NADP+)/methenyltetrahydrofolate cyclohydrolase
MAVTMLDGKAAAAAVKAELKTRVAKLRDSGKTPGLATLLVGDDAGSQVYVRNKHRACAELGIHSVREDLTEGSTSKQVLAVIERFNEDPAIDAFLIQYPVPEHLDYNELLDAMDPKKDADGLHPFNLGSLALGRKGAARPGTPSGIVELLARHFVPIEERHVVIVGRGPTVGRPLAIMLSLKEPNANATVTQCHTGTRLLPELTRQADILVAATGSARLITPEMVQPGAAVLDVGITRTSRGIEGDVHPDVAQVAGWLAPIPGGVGPMTVAMLLRNVVDAAERNPATPDAKPDNGPRFEVRAPGPA